MKQLPPALARMREIKLQMEALEEERKSLLTECIALAKKGKFDEFKVVNKSWSKFDAQKALDWAKREFSKEQVKGLYTKAFDPNKFLSLAEELDVAIPTSISSSGTRDELHFKNPNAKK